MRFYKNLKKFQVDDGLPQHEIIAPRHIFRFHLIDVLATLKYMDNYYVVFQNLLSLQLVVALQKKVKLMILQNRKYHKTFAKKM